MKFLFVIQGEGRGHFTQALALCKELDKSGHRIVGMLVGKSESRQIPAFFANNVNCEIYTFESPDFLPSPANKKPSLSKSIFCNTTKLNVFFRSMQFINRKIKELEPDKVINFYELLTSLTYVFFRPKIPFFCIGHQYVFTHPHYTSSLRKSVSYRAMLFYTRLTGLRAKKILALSFYDMCDAGRICVVPPLLREEVATFTPSEGAYIHGYMLNSGFADEIIDFFKENPDVRGHFFWDKKNSSESEVALSGLSLHALNDQLFLQYMSGCMAYATTAGFESVCEALYFGKPVLMVPTHIEQQCNADDALKVGAGIVSENFDIRKLLEFIPQYKPDKSFKNRVDDRKYRFAAILTEEPESALFPRVPKNKRTYFGFPNFRSHRLAHSINRLLNTTFLYFF